MTGTTLDRVSAQDERGRGRPPLPPEERRQKWWVRATTAERERIEAAAELVEAPATRWPVELADLVASGDYPQAVGAWLRRRGLVP